MKLIITVLVLSLVIQIESLYASRHFMGRDQRKSIEGPKDCGPDEIWSKCGAICEATCQSGSFIVCPLVCAPPACVCRREYYRSLSGKCITADECANDQIEQFNCLKSRGEHAELARTAGVCGSEMCMKYTDIERVKQNYNKRGCYGYVGCTCGQGYIMFQDGICGNIDDCKNNSTFAEEN